MAAIVDGRTRAARSPRGIIDPYASAGLWIYFIQSGADGAIKIGYTEGSPYRRMKSIQCNSPQPLRLLGTKTAESKAALLSAEKRLHVAFATHHIHGEWFHPAPELLDYIASDEVDPPINWAGLTAGVDAMSATSREWLIEALLCMSALDRAARIDEQATRMRIGGAAC